MRLRILRIEHLSLNTAYRREARDELRAMGRSLRGREHVQRARFRFLRMSMTLYTDGSRTR